MNIKKIAQVRLKPCPLPHHEHNVTDIICQSVFMFIHKKLININPNARTLL